MKGRVQGFEGSRGQCKSAKVQKHKNPEEHFKILAKNF